MDVQKLIDTLSIVIGDKLSMQMINEIIVALQMLSEENKQLRNELTMQTALAQNGQSTVEINRQLKRQIIMLKAERDAAIEDIKMAVDAELACDFCKHDYKCQGEECDKYMNGVGCTDENGNYHDWKWTCMDFDFGDCPKLETTPCNGCIGNQMRGFEWRGINYERY